MTIAPQPGIMDIALYQGARRISRDRKVAKAELERKPVWAALRPMRPLQMPL